MEQFNECQGRGTRQLIGFSVAAANVGGISATRLRF